MTQISNQPANANWPKELVIKMKKINDIFSYQLIDQQDQSSQWLKIESTKLITHTSYSAPTTADIIAKINQLNPESAHTFADSVVPQIIASVDSINGTDLGFVRGVFASTSSSRTFDVDIRNVSSHC